MYMENWFCDVSFQQFLLYYFCFNFAAMFCFAITLCSGFSYCFLTNVTLHRSTYYYKTHLYWTNVALSWHHADPSRSLRVIAIPHRNTQATPFPRCWRAWWRCPLVSLCMRKNTVTSAATECVWNWPASREEEDAKERDVKRGVLGRHHEVTTHFSKSCEHRV